MAHQLAATLREANAVLIVDGDTDAIERFFTPDYLVHLTEGDHDGGYAAIRGFLAALRRSFPDLEVEVEILVEANDRIAWQRTLRGTHRADFKGFPASGQRIVWRDMITSRFRDGRIAEDWAVSDLAERLLYARKG